MNDEHGCNDYLVVSDLEDKCHVKIHFYSKQIPVKQTDVATPSYSYTIEKHQDLNAKVKLQQWGKKIDEIMEEKCLLDFRRDHGPQVNHLSHVDKQTFKLSFKNATSPNSSNQSPDMYVPSPGSFSRFIFSPEVQPNSMFFPSNKPKSTQLFSYGAPKIERGTEYPCLVQFLCNIKGPHFGAEINKANISLIIKQVANEIVIEQTGNHCASEKILWRKPQSTLDDVNYTQLVLAACQDIRIQQKNNACQESNKHAFIELNCIKSRYKKIKK